MRSHRVRHNRVTNITPTIQQNITQPLKKNHEILPFETTWIDLQGIMLSEISQTEKDTILFYLHVESKKINE